MTIYKPKLTLSRFVQVTSAITTFGGLAPFSAPCSALSFIEHFLLKKNTSFHLSKICISNKKINFLRSRISLIYCSEVNENVCSKSILNLFLAIFIDYFNWWNCVRFFYIEVSCQLGCHFVFGCQLIVGFVNMYWWNWLCWELFFSCVVWKQQLAWILLDQVLESLSTSTNRVSMQTWIWC